MGTGGGERDGAVRGSDARHHAADGRRVGLTVTGWLLALVVGVLATAYGEGPAVGLAAVGAVVLGAWWVRRRTR
jgi:hypothetical protein